MLAQGHIEIEAVVDAVRLGAADVIGNAGGAQYGPGDRVPDRILRQ